MLTASLPAINHLEFEGRSDTQTNKANAITAVLSAGGVQEAIKAGTIDRNTLIRYLSDGTFREKLEQVKHCLSARLVSKAYEQAESGSERMIEFLLPALEHSFDPGIRREQVRARNAVGLEVFKAYLGTQNGAELGQKLVPEPLTPEDD